MSAPTLPTTAISTLLPILYAAKRTPIFVSRPGMAKTSMVREGAKEIGTDVVVSELHLASMAEPDVRGYLIPQGEYADFTKPSFWRTVEKHPRGVLFLDEFTQCSHEMQKAVAPLLLERRIGDYTLPDGWMVAAAGNRLEDNAGANALLSHVINRVAYIECAPPDVDEWVTWGVLAGLPHELLAMAKLRPDVVFHSELPDGADEPYCTPRSLHALGDIANAYRGGLLDMVDSTVGRALITGCIGKGAAAEVIGMVKTTMRLPGFDTAMADPLNTVIPTAPDEAYAMAMLIAVRANSDKHRESAAQYLTRFPINHALTGIVGLLRRDKGFLHSATFGAWVANNRETVAKFQKFISLRETT